MVYNLGSHCSSLGEGLHVNPTWLKMSPHLCGKWEIYPITYSVLISSCFTLDPHEKHQLIKPELVIGDKIHGDVILKEVGLAIHFLEYKVHLESHLGKLIMMFYRVCWELFKPAL